MEIWTIWLIVAGFFLILEIMTTGFLVFWLGIGALASMVYSLFFPTQILYQVIIFTILSIILIMLTRKLTDKIKPESTAMNVYSILGKKAIVFQEIDDKKNQGQVKVDGDVWSARSDDFEDIIPVNSQVEILRIDGVKVIVKRIS